MMFGAFGNSDHDDAIRIIHKALDSGINFIDTADGYSAGESEEILGKALAGVRRGSVVLAVKFGIPFGDQRLPPPLTQNLRPQSTGRSDRVECAEHKRADRVVSCRRSSLLRGWVG